MKKILITSTDLMMLQFLLPHVHYLTANGFQIEVACSEVGGRFQEVIDAVPENVFVNKINLFRSPLKIGNIKGYFELKRILKKGNYNVVWTNEPVMGVVTRLAAWSMRRQGLKVIYMAHGFHFYKGAPVKNWMLYYPIERFLSRWTETLITINKEDYYRANKKFYAKKTEYVPGVGIDWEKYQKQDVRTKKREELKIENTKMVLLSVGELSRRKNHRVIIESLKLLEDKNIFYFICGVGEKKEELKRLANRLGVGKQVKFLGYRKDLDEIYKMADIFIFPSLQEGLPVSLMEAMASGLPCIVSNIRGSRDLIQNKKNGYLCKTNTAKEYKSLIEHLLIEEKERERIGLQAAECMKKYEKRRILRKIEEICKKEVS